MTKKLILALLAQSVAMADSPCAPEMPVAAGNSWFGVGVDIGAAFIQGSVSEKTTDVSPTGIDTSAQKDALNGRSLYLSPKLNDDVVMNPYASFKTDAELVGVKDINDVHDRTVDRNDADKFAGYLKLIPNTTTVVHNGEVSADFGSVPFNMADSTKKTQSTSSGFVGQLSFHYMTKLPGTTMAVGLHAGIGYNGAKSSLSMPLKTVETTAKYRQSVSRNEDGYCVSGYVGMGNAANNPQQYIGFQRAANPDNNRAFLLEVNEQNRAYLVEQGCTLETINGRYVATKNGNYVPYTAKNVGGNLYAPVYSGRGLLKLQGDNLDEKQILTSSNPKITTKTSISSGFMLQAGTRLGAMIGNVFPHIRVGWACYQLRAQKTHQMSLKDGEGNTRSYVTKYSDGAAAIGSGLGLKDTVEPNIANTIRQYVKAAPANLNENSPSSRDIRANPAAQYKGTIRPDASSDLSTRTVYSKYKWTNALTLGAGIDWAYQNMTFGLYYQAAICQKVNFDNWKGDIVTGAKTVIELPGTAPAAPAEDSNGVFPLDLENNQKLAVKTDTKGTARVEYTTGKPATVSISPVYNTVMLSVKYCFKAA